MSVRKTQNAKECKRRNGHNSINGNEREKKLVFI